MKTKLFVLFVLAGCIIPNLLFSQFTQQGQKFFGTGAVGNADQGNAVAISGDGNTAIVGGYQDNNHMGAVWIFTRSGGVWTQQGQKLVGTGAIGTTVYQGISVAISSDGNTVIFGGSGDNGGVGAVWIFTRSGGVWTQQGSKLVGSGYVGGSAQGCSVSIPADGSTAVEGGDNDGIFYGSIWVFTKTGGVWSQQGPKLYGSGASGDPSQGLSVSVSGDGNTIIDGGYADNNSTGAVWVFTRSGGVWTQQGQKLVGVGSVYASQGYSVSVSADGNTFVEGGPSDNGSEGCIFIFTRSAGVWTQQGPVLVGSGAIGNNGNNVFQGTSVAISLDGNTVVEGGYGDGNYMGAAWCFVRSGGVWTQVGAKLVGTGTIGAAVYQAFTVAISSDGSTVIEGGEGENTNVGAAWVFTYPGIGITPISNEVPARFMLMQNYPNPFNPNSKIKFQIAKSSYAKLIVFDMLGREVAALVNENLNPGTYEVDFDGSTYASGVYFYVLKTESFTETKRMILLK